MPDPLSEIITLLQPRTVFAKRISGAGRWGVRYSRFDQPSFAAAIATFHQEARYLSTSEFRAFALGQIERQRRLVEELGLRLN